MPELDKLRYFYFAPDGRAKEGHLELRVGAQSIYPQGPSALITLDWRDGEQNYTLELQIGREAAEELYKRLKVCLDSTKMT